MYVFNRSGACIQYPGEGAACNDFYPCPAGLQCKFSTVNAGTSSYSIFCLYS